MLLFRALHHYRNQYIRASQGYQFLFIMPNPISMLLLLVTKYPRRMVAVALALVLLSRILLFIRFSLVYTDSDQTLLWQAAKDLMQGNYNEPCFYGQSYNPLFEPLFALPFLYLGMDYPMALPLVTSMMGLFPFLLFSYYFYRRISALAALLPLLLALCMSLEYEILSSIPRGFVAGVFFMSIGIVLLAFHRSNVSRFLGGFLIGIAFYANMNCALMLPILGFLIPINSPEIKRMAKAGIPGFIVGISSIFWNALFYMRHPNLVIHSSPNLELKWSNFLSIMGKLEYYFDFVSPVFWKLGWMTLFLFLFIGYKLWKRNFKIQAITACGIFAMILFTFFVSKVDDASNSVFFSGARMYLAYPFLLLFLLHAYFSTLSETARNKAYLVLAVLAITSLSIKTFAYDALLSHTLRGSAYTVVEVEQVEELRNTCTAMLAYSKVKPELILSLRGNAPLQLINYGCPCLLDSFPATVQLEYERRTWLLPSVLQSAHSPIFIHGIDNVWIQNLDTTQVKLVKHDAEKGWAVIEYQGETEQASWLRVER